MTRIALWAAGIIFLFISLLHGLRLLFKIQVIVGGVGVPVGGVGVPLWISVMGMVISGALSYVIFRILKNSNLK